MYKKKIWNRNEGFSKRPRIFKKFQWVLKIVENVVQKRGFGKELRGF